MTSVFSLVVVLVFVTSIESSDFTSKANSCSKLDRCNSKSLPKTCSCDSDCHAYGTCCHDIGKPNRDHQPVFQCYSRRTPHPVFAKRSCSEDFLGHVGTRGACTDEDEDEMDVGNNLLVTSRVTKITYWNKQCAACNLEDQSDLDFWNIVVACPAHAQIDRYLIRSNLTFDQDKLQWGVAIGDDFLQCFVRYSPPYYAEKAKPCTPNIISQCPDDYDNEAVSAKCSQYYAERKLKDSDTYFKNVHCALCNGVEMKDLECPGTSSPGDDIEEHDFRDMVEEIFQNGQWLRKEPGKTFECSRNYTYDPFREKCRPDEIPEEEGVVTIVSNAAHELGKGFLTLLAPFVAFIYKTVVFEHSFASQLSVRRTP